MVDDSMDVDAIESIVVATPGVARLHPGMFGEVATYLPGRRVTGVRVSDGHIDVHVTCEALADVRHVAAEVRRRVAAMFPGTPVDVTVEDIAAAGPQHRGPAASDRSLRAIRPDAEQPTTGGPS